ncbi:hypothetical protein D9M68_792140 [compost metagenome]
MEAAAGRSSVEALNHEAVVVARIALGRCWGNVQAAGFREGIDHELPPTHIVGISNGREFGDP